MEELVVILLIVVFSLFIGVAYLAYSIDKNTERMEQLTIHIKNLYKNDRILEERIRQEKTIEVVMSNDVQG